MRLPFRLVLSAAVVLNGCAPKQPDTTATSSITIGAAANLTGVLDEIGRAFAAKTGNRVVLSYASTAQLAQQIENSAPFDVFAAADTEHVDTLVRAGKIIPDTRALYARGVLALWSPKGEALHLKRLEDLARPDIRSVAIATPTAAPYGQAAVQALQKSGLWTQIQPKVVYSGNISMAREFASTGNADAAFTALSLVLKEKGVIIRVDESLYPPIDQAVGVVSTSRQPDAARGFTAFLIGPAGQEILQKYGYRRPPAR